MEPCLRVQLKTVWCKITLLVWADAEIIGLWEPILPGMCRKYFGELPQKNLFCMSILSFVMLSEKSPSSHAYKVR